MPSYSIVVVTWQSAAHLSRLVGSMNHRLPDDPELIVVDNASYDDPEPAARAWRGPTRFERLDTNVGFGTATNAGVAEATGEAIVLLNPDTQLLDSRLGDLAAFALEHRALAGPRLRNPSGTPQPSASASPVGIWPWVHAVLPGAVAPGPVQARIEPWRLERTTRVGWLTGACIAGPTDVLRDLGPFDPAIEMYGEDLDLCLRAKAAGVPSYFCPATTEVMHRAGASSAVRYDDGPEQVIAQTQRAVLRRAFGERRERRARDAQMLNLRLRVAAKRALRRSAYREQRALAALVSAEQAPELPSAPSPPG